MKKIVVFILAMQAVTIANAQLADSLRAHIDTAFIIMQHSLYSNKVDWEKEKLIAYESGRNLTTKEALFPVIAEVYKKLNDHHGWFQQYDDKLRLPATDTRQPSEGMKKEWAKGPKVAAQMIGDIAYLRIPGMYVYNQQQIDYCANWLADSVRSLAARNPKGWIIDLRLNTGGHAIPMMAGLASFFPEGPISYCLDKNGKEVSHAVIRNRNFVQEDSLSAHLKTYLPDLSKARVAVIIGSGTGSSGEGVAFNFKYRAGTKLFGEQSAGVANATEGFLFNDHQSYFLLTTSVLANKKKRALPMVVVPAKKVVNNDMFEALDKDNAVIAAIKWLGK